MPTVKLATILRPTDNYGATSPCAVATSGDRIFMIGYRKLYASNRGRTFKLVGPKRPPMKIAAHDTGLLQFDSDVVVDGKAIWVCGYRGVARSTDGGATFQVVPTPKGGGAGGLPALSVIASAPDGSIWVGGDHGYLAVHGAKFKRVRGLDGSAVHGLSRSPLGMLVTTDAGGLYIASGTKVRKTKLAASGPLHDACVTPAGTIIAVGSGVAYRAGDGEAFRKIKVPSKNDVYAIAALPDGRLVAGADEGQLLVSLDDGRSFAPLRGGKHKSAPKRGAYAFDLACSYRDGVLIGGACQGLHHAT